MLSLVYPSEYLKDLQSRPINTRGSRWPTTKELRQRSISRLDEKNYLHWSMRIKAHLRHKGLLKYILKFPVPLSGAAANAVAKKHAETVDILMNFMSETAFESVHYARQPGQPVWNLDPNRLALRLHLLQQ
ncbi:hypothetical protein PCANC_26494 [Puccinia coronata f. sp. avenae]|uniref:DUF4219 domain-containing protein n=1 Tax=Puccinia coronata f. sp. avenae TaxID=200324 RepID=A0A2N5S1Y8_9BASI|nr:hypothetical protein PCANC_26494 [Puccinia coronata f. sp. avenae]